MYLGVDNIARRIMKAYIGVNNIARLFYSLSSFGGYTGDYECIEVEDADGNIFELYTL